MWDGVFYGVIASAVFGALSWIAKQRILPAFQALRYDGAKITGIWDVYFEGGTEPFARIDFKQTGRTISGVSQVSKNKTGQRRDRKYRYWGRSLDSSVILLFEDEKNPGVLGGSLALHMFDSDRLNMRGLSIFYKPEANDVVSARVELWKSGAALPNRVAAPPPQEANV